MRYVYSSNVKAGSHEKFYEWVRGCRKEFEGAHPEGWKFVGAYTPVFGLGDHHVELHWEIENYAALDHARAAAREGGAWTQALHDLHEHLEVGTGRGRVLSSVDHNEGVLVGC